MATIRKGSKLVCVRCGREVVITSAGYSVTNIWCCIPTNPMVTKTEAAKITKANKPTEKKPGAKKAAKKTAVKKPTKKAVAKTAVKKPAKKAVAKTAAKKTAAAKKSVKKKAPTKKKAAKKK